MAHCYSHLYGLQTIGLRFFTVYGPWGRPDMAMWLFTKAMLAGQTIQVFNNGNMRRDFTYIDDIVTGVERSLFTDGLAPYEVFNIGNHRPENLMDMIGVLAAVLGRKPVMEMLPMQPGDVPATYADIDRIRAKLGFEPTTPISEGIPKFVEWYLQYHKLLN
jgi:UDP-glucuronate 4-epimerase